MIINQRMIMKFGNLLFILRSTHRNKDEAREFAKKLRKGGDRFRIIPISYSTAHKQFQDGYGVYAMSKAKQLKDKLKEKERKRRGKK
jgi:hypothetical protein